MSIGVRTLSYKYVFSVYLLCLAYAFYVILGGKREGMEEGKRRLCTWFGAERLVSYGSPRHQRASRLYCFSHPLLPSHVHSYCCWEGVINKGAPLLTGENWTFWCGLSKHLFLLWRGFQRGRYLLLLEQFMKPSSQLLILSLGLPRKWPLSHPSVTVGPGLAGILTWNVQFCNMLGSWHWGHGCIIWSSPAESRLNLSIKFGHYSFLIGMKWPWFSFYSPHPPAQWHYPGNLGGVYSSLATWKQNSNILAGSCRLQAEKQKCPCLSRTPSTHVGVSSIYTSYRKGSWW